MRAHFEILTLRTFTGNNCKIALGINLRKWLDILICKKSKYTQKCMFIKTGNSDFWVDKIEWNGQV